MTEAEETITEYQRRWARGDDALTVQDMQIARDGLTRVKNLLIAAERGVRQARHALVNDDESLARMVVPVVEAMLPGVAVEIHTRTPIDAPVTVPTVRVIQTKVPDRDLIDGTISGAVEIRTHLPEWVTKNPLTGEAFTKALDKVGIRGEGVDIDATHGKSSQGMVMHSTRVAIPRGYEPVPAIKGDPQAWRVSAFAQAVAGDVGARAASGRGDKSTIICHMPESKILTHSVGKDGKRNTLAEVTLKVSPRVAETYAGGTRASASSAEIGQYISAGLDSLVGAFAPGLGRVEAVKKVETTPYYGAGLDVRAQIALVSRTP